MAVEWKRLWLGPTLIAAASAVLLLSDLGHRSASDRRVPRIAVLQHASQPMIDEGVRGMLDGLAGRGFVDGQSIQVRRFNAEGDIATANTIAKAMAGDDYDLLLTATTVSLQAVASANAATRKRHVFALVSDPAGAGVGISRDNPLQHPPYMAGFGTLQPVAETFRLARAMLPSLQTVGVVWNPAEANSEANLRLARAVCKELGIALLEATIDSSSAVREAVSSLLSRGIEALWVGGDVMVLTAVDTIIATTRDATIPVFTSMPGNAERGALFDLGANYLEVGRLAGDLAARVLQGTDPATIAIENVMPERLIINRAALNGLKQPWAVPASLAARAHFVGETPPEPSVTATPGNVPLSKRWQIDMLQYINSPDTEECDHGFRRGLADAGLVEGRDYQLRVRNAQGDMPTLSTLVDAALADGANLLFTLSTPTLQAAMQRAGSVPVVFTFVANAIAAGAGSSLTQHRPNVTGIPTMGAYDELLDVLQQCMPNAKRIGTLFVPAEVNAVYSKDQLAAAAQRRGLELITVAANTSAEVPDAALSLLSRDIDAITQVASNLTTAAFASIAQPARRARIPIFGFLTSDLNNGAAVVLARDYFDGGHQAAGMAARIMRGTSPADIPFAPLHVERLLINQEAARSVSLTIPAALMQRAQQPRP